ncbi:hypothetical protein Scep_004698 [Stephania cephalantha]|uniref:Uncharacterized protein n=1 Tax=Stephania cephalantha TaxID=152367 RepID=A0AAP0PXI9_9MAGN
MSGDVPRVACRSGTEVAAYEKKERLSECSRGGETQEFREVGEENQVIKLESSGERKRREGRGDRRLPAQPAAGRRPAAIGRRWRPARESARRRWRRSRRATAAIAHSSRVAVRSERTNEWRRRRSAAAPAGRGREAAPAVTPARRQRLRRGSGSDRQRRTSDDATRRDAEKLTSGARRVAAGERRCRWPASDGARYRPVGRRRDGAIVELLSIEWVHWQVSHGYCYLRYESVRAGRQGPRPKPEVLHGRPSISPN